MSENDEFDFGDMIFDIGCGKCGEVIFSLPYKLDTVHSMKCHGCGETNIIEVDEKGGIGHILKPELDEQIANFKKHIEGLNRSCPGSYDNMSEYECKNSGTIKTGEFKLVDFKSKGFKISYTVACKNRGSESENCTANSYNLSKTISLKDYVSKN